jgi:DNA-binding CsgD family transcriptional regulator
MNKTATMSIANRPNKQQRAASPDHIRKNVHRDAASTIQSEAREVVPCARNRAAAMAMNPALAGGASQALSEREAEIMRWLKIGKTNYEIGRILEISAFTVKNHLQRIFRKLVVFNRAHAVAKFVSAESDSRN